VELFNKNKKVPLSQEILHCEVLLWSQFAPLQADQPTPTLHVGIQ